MYWDYALFFFLWIIRMTRSVVTVRIVEKSRQMMALGMKPATRNDTNEIAATVMA